MERSNETIQYDVVITGAGPAGCACALALKGSGLKVAILDKYTFPRDKVCGDAIPGRAIKALRNIDAAFADVFKAFPAKLVTKSTTLHYKGKTMTFNWVGEAFTCTRMAFDNFLFTLVQDNTDTHIHTNAQATRYTPAADGMTIQLADGRVLKTRLLVGADGAQSIAAKQLVNKVMDRAHHVGSVRAYYTHVGGMDGRVTEIYFDKQFLPSYLWVFPLPGNSANVGFGMLSSEIARRKINIKEAFYQFIDRSPELKMKFASAMQTSKLEGFGLPLGSNIGSISGNRFMLAGDAASLIDPISGDGIGNAMLSGRLAAMQAINCCANNDFSARHMEGYDAALLAAIGKELKTRARTQQVLSKMPWLLDLIFLAGKNKLVKRLLQKGL